MGFRSRALALMLVGATGVSAQTMPADNLGSRLPKQHFDPIVAFLSKYFEPKDAVETVLRWSRYRQGADQNLQFAPWSAQYVGVATALPKEDAERVFFVNDGKDLQATSEEYCSARQRVKRRAPKPSRAENPAVEAFAKLPQCIEVPTSRLLMSNLASSLERAEKEYYLKRHEAMQGEINALKQRLDALERAVGGAAPVRAANRAASAAR